MNFQNPTFLWALLLLAIPLIIHLFNFRRYKKVLFSNVAMLKEIQTESRKTRQIRKWLILAARMLALAALVLAFARPYIPQGGLQNGRQLISLFLDNSQSMSAEGENGQLFENAKNTAREILQNLPPDAEIQIVDNALSPFSNRTFTPANATKIVDDLDIDFHPNDLNSVVQKARNKFVSEGYASHHVFGISDFQNGVTMQETRVDSGVNMHLLRTTPVALQNLSIDSVWLEEPIVRPGVPVKLNVKIVNNGDQSVESSTVVLSINGVQQGVESFGISAKAVEVLSLSFTSTQTGWIDGEVSLTDVPVTFDNNYFFTLEIKPSISVLQIGKRAPELNKIFEGDEIFTLKQVQEGSVDYGQFNAYDFIILNELKEIGSGLTEQLRQFAEKGGVVAIIPSDNPTQYKALSTLGVATYGKLATKEISITPNNLKQPFIRDVYTRIPQNVILPKINKCYDLKMGAAQPILTLKDNQVVLARARISNGSIFQFAMPLDAAYSNIAAHELFVVTMLKMAFSKMEKQRLAYPLFHKEPIAINAINGAEQSLRLRLGEQSVLVESANSRGGLRFWLNEEINSAGIYSLGSSVNKALGKIALNYSRVESKQRFASDSELKKQYVGASVSIDNASSAVIKNATNSLSSGKPLWKVFIILCLIFLLIEILLLRFLKS